MHKLAIYGYTYFEIAFGERQTACIIFHWEDDDVAVDIAVVRMVL